MFWFVSQVMFYYIQTWFLKGKLIEINFQIMGLKLSSEMKKTLKCWYDLKWVCGKKGKVLLKVPHLFVDNNNDVYQDFCIVGVMFRKAIHGERGGVMQTNHWVFGFFLHFYLYTYLRVYQRQNFGKEWKYVLDPC